MSDDRVFLKGDIVSWDTPSQKGQLFEVHGSVWNLGDHYRISPVSTAIRAGFLRLSRLGLLVPTSQLTLVWRDEA